MANYRDDPLYPRIARAVESLLASDQVVRPVEVIQHMGLLSHAALQDWRAGRVLYLERAIDCNLTKLARLLRILRFVAHDLNLVPYLETYTREGCGKPTPLRFSKSGDPRIEDAYRRHFRWPGKGPVRLPRGRGDDTKSRSRDRDIKVFIAHRDSVCDDCGHEIGKQSWVHLAGDRGALCLTCADLDHLVFLPSGDAALTRRGRKHSTLSAIVLKWSRSRRRYERQGVLVEEGALARAEQQCLDDAEARARRRRRAAERRAELDQDYVNAFAGRVRELFPTAPEGRERVIAEHACQRYSGRVGRSAAAKALDEQAVRLAVTAHVRHAETEYDVLLAAGMERREARERVVGDVARVLEAWARPVANPAPPSIP